MSAPSGAADEHGRSFWIGLASGTPLMLWGVWLYLDATPDLRRRTSLLGWLVGLDLAHDLVLAPLIVLIGLAVARVVPPSIRGLVQAGLVASGCVVLVGLLPLLGSAPTANPTIQPIAYGPAVLLVLSLIWASVALAALVGRLRQRR